MVSRPDGSALVAGVAPGGAVVEVRNLTKRYGRTLALDDVSLDIAPGERYALLGPNGAGKTTLIHVLCTIHQADSGLAVVSGYDVHKRPRLARRHLGVVFQESSLDTRLTVTENLEFHGRIFGVPGRLRRQRIAELLELVELGDWRDHLVRALSKGMQRRLEIARALVHDARLLVLDEPTVGLDAQTRLRMWDYLRDLQQRRDLTVLVTTHYIEEVDACDRVCIIDHGKVLTVGTPNELKAAHGRTLVRVLPRDAETAAAIRAEHPETLAEGDVLVLPAPDEAALETLLARHGARLRAFTVERPTLESVFLSLTGRAIRDQAAGARDRLLAFANRGGEHTR
jgi:ABC-2 type transport system ATP-binding protein